MHKISNRRTDFFKLKNRTSAYVSPYVVLYRRCYSKYSYIDRKAMVWQNISVYFYEMTSQTIHLWHYTYKHFSKKFSKTNDNAPNRIVVQHCVERGLTTVQTKRKMEAIERQKHVFWILVYTWLKMLKDGWSDDPIEEACDRPTKREDQLKIGWWTSYVKTAFWQYVKWVTCLGVGNHLFRGFCLIS